MPFLTCLRVHLLENQSWQKSVGCSLGKCTVYTAFKICYWRAMCSDVNKVNVTVAREHVIQYWEWECRPVPFFFFNGSINSVCLNAVACSTIHCLLHRMCWKKWKLFLHLQRTECSKCWTEGPFGVYHGKDVGVFQFLFFIRRTQENAW